MQERNIIGGFTAAVLSPFVEGWQRIIWFLLLAVILILGDLRFGIAAAQKRGEKIRPSRAVRRSLNKLVDYICWLSIATVVGVNFGSVFGLPLLSVIIMAVVCIIEMSSIIDNYLEYKGIKKKVNVIKLIARIFKKPELEDVLEPTDDDKKVEEPAETEQQEEGDRPCRTPQGVDAKVKHGKTELTVGDLNKDKDKDKNENENTYEEIE